jgi:hypothetical protein
MKLEKKHYIIIGVVVAIIIIWYFFFKKKKAESNYSIPAGGGGWKTCLGGKVVPNNQPCPPVNSSRISCPRGQVYNDKTGKCEGKSWGTGPTNPNVASMTSGTGSIGIVCPAGYRMVGGQCVPNIMAATTYVYHCAGPPPTTGFSNKPSGNCPEKGKETILKTL